MSTHLAAVLPAKGQPLEVQARSTPKPGPGELLIAVKAVALNPADHLISDLGLFIPKYPAVLGFDLAGLVIAVGDDVPTENVSDSSGLFFQPGNTRIAAYAGSFWRDWKPDYGAFQELCIVPWQHAVPVDESISWAQAATLPVSVQVPLCAWEAMGLHRSERPGNSLPNAGVKAHLQDAHKKEALLIWGASSSVGSMGVQSARLLRDDGQSPFAAVYATAGSANIGYVKSLGADRVFDYKDPNVVETIIAAAKDDGLIIRHCFLATGELALCQAILEAFLGEEQANRSKIGSAPMVPPDAKVVDGIDVIFLQPSAEENARLEQFRYCMGTWLKENLALGSVRPSPEPTVIGKGLEVISSGLNMLRKGVSCTKLVVEMED